MDSVNYYKKRIRLREGVTAAIRETSIPGTFVIEAMASFMPMPIGTVWFQWIGNETITINESYVPKQFRRCGIRTLLHERLIKEYPDLKEITTMSCSTDSKPWLKKMGFKRDKHKDWVLELD